jgi:hypothetical protein
MRTVPRLDLPVLGIGVASGAAAILYCVSPVFLFLLGLTYAALYAATSYLAVLGSRHA